LLHRRDCFPPRLRSNVAVPLQHGPAHVSHDIKHGALGHAVLPQFGTERMPQIVKLTVQA